MAKIQNDKYYTSLELAKYVVNKTKEVIGAENIVEYVESSAGAGIFLDLLDKPYLAFDIESEDSRILRQDYLEVDIKYKEGRCVIGNPPYGEKNLLSLSFFRKSIEIAEYISFILPISQLNNNQQMFEYDLIYSEDLGKRKYSDIEVHCCLNIYKRPENGLHKSPIKYKLKDITLKECRKARNQFLPKDFKYDLGICTWGSVGKEVEFEGQFNQELYIRINNGKVKDKVIEVIKATDWCKVYPMTTMPRLKQWQLLKYLKEKIPELE